MVSGYKAGIFTGEGGEMRKIIKDTWQIALLTAVLLTILILTFIEAMGS